MTTASDRPRGAELNAAPPAAPARGVLSRRRVLAAGLHLVDEHGLAALSMRRLGAELGVEAMSLYNHVPSKDALLDGLGELLWDEVQLPPEDTPDWKEAIRATAGSLRRLARAHPHAYPLLLARAALPEPALRVFDALLRTLRGAGFDPDLAAHALGTLVAHAVGYAMVELACSLGQPDLAARCAIPADAGGRFADVARVLAECDPDAQFAFGLETILDGLEARRRAGRSER